MNRERITLETILTPAPVEPSGTKGRRRKGPGRTDYLLCVQIGEMPKSLPVAVLEAKKESEDPLKGMSRPKDMPRTKKIASASTSNMFSRPMVTYMANSIFSPTYKAALLRLSTSRRIPI
ncbi:hypothetical protein [Nitrosomonas sp.]|uniref:hypothetical protein n=1 Tax=Nitrosomonas sp. TaxID=42353 RepID=UPI0032EC3F96